MPGQSITVRTFGKTRDGSTARLYGLQNASGAKVSITDFGATIVAIEVPDSAGTLADIVLGYDTLEEYEADTLYMGSVIGRVANRIAGAKFTLDGQIYSLAKNEGENSLHGGNRGFNKILWNCREYPSEDGPALELTHVSPDGEEGYPGNLSVRILYVWTGRNELKVHYTASTDKCAVVNLTNHSYFNLSGDPERNILDHLLYLNAARFLPIDENLIPTGELGSVAGTVFDFRAPIPVGKRIFGPDGQLKRGRGYDHNWILADRHESDLAARVTEPASGRVLEIRTMEPGVQFYSGNFLDGTVAGKNGLKLGNRTGFCLETQHFPDSPNRLNFPSVTLRPGQVYRSQTSYLFTVV